MMPALIALLDEMTRSTERATEALRRHNAIGNPSRPASASATSTASLDENIRRGQASATLGTLRRRVPAPRR